MSFQTGLSGLRAATSDLNITANNIANATTVGFKQSRAEFGDVYATSLAESGSRTIGSGVALTKVAQQFTQGTISFTRRPLDLALNGRGFFVLDADGARSYTRAGIFGIDKDGFIRSSSGAGLVGYAADEEGNIDLGNERTLRIEAFNLPPRRTSTVDIGFNLDASSEAPDNTLFPTFDSTDQRTYNHASSLTVYDSEGMPHVATLYYRKDQPDPNIEAGRNNDWAVWVAIDGKLVNNNPTIRQTTAPVTTAGSSNTGAATIGAAAIAAAGTYSTNYANEYTVTFDSPATTFDVVSRNTQTGVSTTIASNVAYSSGANIAALNALGINVAITGTGATAPAAGDTFTIRPPIPVDADGNVTAFRIQFDTSGELNTSPPTGFTTRLVIDDWVPANDVQTTLGTNAEPVGPNGGAAAPTFNGVVDEGFSDFVIDINGSTQFGDDFNLDSLRQDGYGPGQLVGTEVSETGVIFARYTNGQSLVLGQVLLADFQNQGGLTPIGNAEWSESFESGQPIPGIADAGAFGSLQSGALEDSNVDLSEELVDLIVAQRNFQANAKTIETNNAITQTVINIRG
ncbi:MAG: flagellar hook-basal body complex protein [Gammaproteobacteria bacterium]